VEQNRSMETMAAVSTERLSFSAGEGDPELVTAGAVSPNMFAALRVPPLLGRTLVEGDGGPEPAGVVVLGYDFWQRRFGGDSTVVGRTIDLGWENDTNPVSSLVVGVMPQGFSYPDPDVDLWAPLLLDPERTWRGGHWFWMVGRLEAGVSLESAQEEMAILMARWRDDYPDHHVGHFLMVMPLLDDLVADVRPTLMILLGAVGFVLLIACANVASLLMARGQQRSREMAVRSALGAGQTRLLGQLLTEALILALIGGTVGLALSVLGVDALLALEGGTLPRIEDVALDGRVLAFTAVLVAATTLVFGLLPAVRTAGGNLAQAFSDGGRKASASSGRLRFGRGLVVSQVTLALLLVLGAGLMTKSLWRTLQQDPGFRTENVLATLLTFPEAGYTAAEKVDFLERLSERVDGLPAVEHTGIVSRPPLLYDMSTTRFHIEGRPEPGTGEESPTGSYVVAGPDLFETLGISLLRGRLFEAGDGVTEDGVVIIDETLAERYWPGEDPIGRRMRMGPPGQEYQTIVGIVTRARFDALTMQEPTYYEPARQAVRTAPFLLGTMAILVRTTGDPLELAGPLRDAVRELDADLPILSMRSMDDMVSRSVAGPRFIMILMAVFAGVALVLGAIGVYGVVSQAVIQRTHEIGIRRALGARGGQVLAMVLRQGGTLVVGGVCLGLAAALALNRVLVGFLYEVSGTDPLTYTVVAGAVAAVALLATLIPARRATRVDPLDALRTD